MARPESITTITLTVQQKQLFTIAKKKSTLTGKHAAIAKKTRDLGAILYGTEQIGKQQLEGEWSSEADRFMANDPRKLQDFFSMRGVVEAALGDRRYLVNPRRCICPFVSIKKSSKCKLQMKGTVELSRVNDISTYITHLKKAHDANPAAELAVKRLEKAKENRKTTGPRLDVFVGPMVWEGDAVDGYEDRRQLLEMPDAFSPTFELGSDAHREWVANAKAQPERLPEEEEDEEEE